MQAQTNKRIGGWAKLGRVLVWVGSLVFVASRALDSAGERILARLRAATLGGWLRLGIGTESVVGSGVEPRLVARDNGEGAGIMLPLVILFAGFVIMRSVTHAEEAASIQEQARPQRETTDEFGGISARPRRQIKERRRSSKGCACVEEIFVEFRVGGVILFVVLCCCWTTLGLFRGRTVAVLADDSRGRGNREHFG